MKGRSQWELSSAERELDETKALVHQQYAIVKRLKRLGADSREAILLLLDLLDLQQSRERRLSYLRMPNQPSARRKLAADGTNRLRLRSVLGK